MAEPVMDYWHTDTLNGTRTHWTSYRYGGGRPGIGLQVTTYRGNQCLSAVRLPAPQVAGLVAALTRYDWSRIAEDAWRPTTDGGSEP